MTNIKKLHESYRLLIEDEQDVDALVGNPTVNQLAGQLHPAHGGDLPPQLTVNNDFLNQYREKIHRYSQAPTLYLNTRQLQGYLKPYGILDNGHYIYVMRDPANLGMIIIIEYDPNTGQIVAHERIKTPEWQYLNGPIDDEKLYEGEYGTTTSNGQRQLHPDIKQFVKIRGVIHFWNPRTGRYEEWTDDHAQYFREHYGITPPKDIEDHPFDPALYDDYGVKHSDEWFDRHRINRNDSYYRDAKRWLRFSDLNNSSDRIYPSPFGHGGSSVNHPLM